MAKNSVTFDMELPEGIEQEYSQFYKEYTVGKRLKDAEEETGKLLKTYEKYKEIEARIISLEKRRDLKSVKKRNMLGKNLERVNQEIRFKNPLIWMMFKEKRGLLANRAEDLIANFGDFKAHCRHEKLTCSRRITFLNDHLKQKGIDLFDRKAFPDSLSLRDVYSKREVVDLSTGKKVIESWKKYEFYTKRGKPAKWRNFKISSSLEPRAAFMPRCLKERLENKLKEDVITN